MRIKELYHASQTANLELLKPFVSNHGIPQVYLSSKRENVLVYLSNAVEKYCKETGYHYDGNWYKWASYGFDQDGKLQFEEYYPNALHDTYKGVSGYIYTVDMISSVEPLPGIQDAYISSDPIQVSRCEFVEDAYHSINEAERNGLIRIVRYADLETAQINWLKHTIQREYASSENHPDYRHFLCGKFSDFIYD